MKSKTSPQSNARLCVLQIPQNLSVWLFEKLQAGTHELKLVLTKESTDGQPHSIFPCFPLFKYYLRGGWFNGYFDIQCRFHIPQCGSSRLSIRASPRNPRAGGHGASKTSRFQRHFAEACTACGVHGFTSLCCFRQSLPICGGHRRSPSANFPKLGRGMAQLPPWLGTPE